MYVPFFIPLTPYCPPLPPAPAPGLHHPTVTPSCGTWLWQSQQTDRIYVPCSPDPQFPSFPLWLRPAHLLAALLGAPSSSVTCLAPLTRHRARPLHLPRSSQRPSRAGIVMNPNSQMRRLRLRMLRLEDHADVSCQNIPLQGRELLTAKAFL